jgi:hypothetical protein
LGSARLFDANVESVGMVHRQPIVEALFVGKLIQDQVIELLHYSIVRVFDEVIVGNCWQCLAYLQRGEHRCGS